MIRLIAMMTVLLSACTYTETTPKTSNKFVANPQTTQPKTLAMNPVLTAHAWQLTHAHAQAPLDKLDHHTIVTFDSNHTMRITMGCNRISIPIILTNNTISPNPNQQIIGTEMFCVGKDDIEQAFVGFMSQTLNYQLGNGTLTLSDGGQKLIFAKNPNNP